MEELCHCGRPLHYTDDEIKKYVEQQIKNLGPTIDVVLSNKIYSVPRHFIALHGLNPCDLESFGFLT